METSKATKKRLTSFQESDCSTVRPHDLANTLASKRYRARLSSNEAAAKVFYKEDKSLYVAGEILIQKDLARTLKLLSELGPDAFYKGEIAELIVKEMQKNGGLITLQDLKNYNIVEREPLAPLPPAFPPPPPPPRGPPPAAAGGPGGGPRYLGRGGGKGWGGGGGGAPPPAAHPAGFLAAANESGEYDCDREQN